MIFGRWCLVSGKWSAEVEDLLFPWTGERCTLEARDGRQTDVKLGDLLRHGGNKPGKVRFKVITGWIGVDLDGTLAKYAGWKGLHHVGEPIAPMVDRVKVWLAEGQEVRIMTARMSRERGEAEREETRKAVREWTLIHCGQALEATCEKDFNMVELWDDRARRVEYNTGREYDRMSDEEKSVDYMRGYNDGHRRAKECKR